MFETLYQMPRMHSYVAYSGDEPVGVGYLYINGEVGALFNGTTLTAEDS
jgi:hypothetical protein